MNIAQRIDEKLKDPKNEIMMVRKGMYAEDIEPFLTEKQFLVKDVLERLAIPASTYFAKKKNHSLLDASVTEKLIRLFLIFKLASSILGQEEAKKWLYREIPSLGNEIPMNMLDTDAGRRLVEQALLQIKYGIYG